MKLYLYLRPYPQDGNRLIGGTAKAVNGLAYGLATAGADVSVLCEADDESETKSHLGFRIMAFQQTKSKNPFAISQGLGRFLSLSATKPDLVLLNGMFHPPNITVARILRSSRVPYVVITHGVYHKHVFEKRPLVKWPFWHLFERPMIQRASAIQLLDIRHASWLTRLGITRKLLEVPNGVMPGDIVEPPSYPEVAPGDKIRLLFFGRLNIWNKGIDSLILAVADLIAKTEASINLVIQGPDQGDLKTIENMIHRYSLEQFVEVRPPNYTTPVSEIMSDYHIICMPSRWEGFGLAALEAMLAGRVVMVSKDAGIAPHVRRSGCGILVSPNPESIANGLRELLGRRDEWQEMGRSGWAYAVSNLRWDAIGRRALDQYAQLIS